MLPPAQNSGVQMKNLLMAGALLVFTGGIYYTAISKMRPETDDLSKVISSERK